MSRLLPILFNAEMVRAILDGRKTVTRRVVKFAGNRNSNWTGYIKDGLALYNGTNEPCNKPAPYQVEDILYVRETWQYLYELDENEQIIEGTGKYYYAATDDEITFNTYIDSMGVTHEHVPWHPSIHMPKEAARIFLKVTNVRVERLQDMTEEQAREEEVPHGLLFENSDFEITALSKFPRLWNSTIKKSDLELYGWDANPWVWVIEFERCEKPEG